MIDVFVGKRRRGEGRDERERDGEEGGVERSGQDEEWVRGGVGLGNHASGADVCVGACQAMESDSVDRRRGRGGGGEGGGEAFIAYDEGVVPCWEWWW